MLELQNSSKAPSLKSLLHGCHRETFSKNRQKWQILRPEILRRWIVPSFEAEACKSLEHRVQLRLLPVTNQIRMEIAPSTIKMCRGK